LAAIAFALVVMGGEVYRSWGERAVALWLDDFLVGVALITAAAALSTETPARRAAFTGAWGFAAGIIFISAFDKLLLPAVLGPGAQLNPLNVFVSLSLIASIAGFVWSLIVPLKNSS
jgi:hypothetical protein